MQNPCRTIVVNFQRMDEKTLGILEFPVVLQRLAAYADFGISAELARGLRPSSNLEKVRLRQSRTTEARRLLNLDASISVGGARDIRSQVELASRSGVLEGPNCWMSAIPSSQPAILAGS